MQEEERAKWDAIKACYMTGEMSIREMAKKYGVSESRIYKKATSDGWKKLKEKIRQKADEKYVARASRLRARELETISSAAGKMAILLEKTVEELSQQDTGTRLRGLKGLSATASAIQSNTETLMKLYGIQTPAQEAAQKIARQRLTLDQRKQKLEEGKLQEANKPKAVRYVVEIETKDAVEGDELDG